MFLHYYVKYASCMYILNPHLAGKFFRGSVTCLVSKPNKMLGAELSRDRKTAFARKSRVIPHCAPKGLLPLIHPCPLL